MAKKTDEQPAAPAPTALEKTVADYGALATKPDWISGADTRGAENVDMSDLRLPRLLIAQDLSPQRKPTKPEYIPGLELYDMFNNLTRDVYGRGPVAFLPIRMDKRAMEWYPRDSKDGEGIKDRDVKWDDPRCAFGADGTKPVATRYYDFVALLLPTYEPIVISLHDTQFKHGQTLLSLIKLAGGPFWSRVYLAETVLETKDKYEWGSFKFTPAGWANPEMAVAGESAFESFKGKTIAVDETDDPDAGSIDKGQVEPASTSAADVV